MCEEVRVWCFVCDLTLHYYLKIDCFNSNMIYVSPVVTTKKILIHNRKSERNQNMPLYIIKQANETQRNPKEEVRDKRMTRQKRINRMALVTTLNAN